MVTRAQRALRHLFYPRSQVRRVFPPAVLQRIEAAIRASEREHRAELRFVVEGGLDVLPVWRGLTPRDRAIELFSGLRVWDTEDNCGVLIYVQLVDHDIEIVADRGVNACVPQSRWDAICQRMETAFRERCFEDGAVHGVNELTALLAQHFPAAGDANPNELPDKPVVLSGGS